MKTKVSAAILTVAALALGACSGTDDGGPTKDPTKTPIGPVKMKDISTKLPESTDSLPPKLLPADTAESAVDLEAASLLISTKMASEFSKPGSNIWFSAASAQQALAMLADGADEATGRALADYYSGKDAKPGVAGLFEAIKSLQSGFAGGDSDQGGVRFGAAYFINEDAAAGHIDPDKVAKFAKAIGGHVAQGDPDKLNEAGSAWAKLVTAGLIPNLPIEFDGNTTFALASSIYARGAWSGDKPEVTLYDFTSDQGKKSEVKGLRFKSSNVTAYRVARGYIVRAQSHGPAFELFLPDEGVDPASLTPKDWAYDVNDEVYATAVIPTLNVTSKLDLTEKASAIGMPDISKGTYPGFVVDGDSLRPELMVQDAALVVDKNGYAAAAVTVIAEVRAAPGSDKKPIDIVFDRPFAARIHSYSPDWTLFYGVINDAAAAQHG